MAAGVEAQVQSAQAVLLREAGSREGARLAVSKAITDIIPSSCVDNKMRLLTIQEKLLLELSARAALATMAAYAVEAGRPLMEWSLEENGAPTVPRLLDMFLLITELKWSDAGLVFTLMEDLVETSTKQDCSGVFAYLEGQAAQLMKPRAQGSGRFTMLRICNSLLRRLSKSHDAVLCGRILIFLAQLQPLSDRSGLNVQAAFNTSNVTAVEEVPEGATDSNGDAIDKQFYQRFWGLQSVFQRPVAAMAAGPWLRVIADLKAVAAEFDKLKLIASAPGPPDASGPLPAVKYLSSSKLMRLQLQDAGFRRQFLVQALIFLHCCRHPGRSEKAAALRPKQVEEAEAVEDAFYHQLEATPEHGTEFAAAIRAVLNDETFWVQWKNVLPAASVPGAPVKAEVCPSFERPLYVPPPAKPPPKPAAAVASRKRQSADGKQATPGGTSKRLRLGTPALDRLWNQAPNNMAGLKVSERRHLPTLREFLNPVIEDMDPENDIEDAYRRKHDKAYQWKALRMISRESLPIFAKTAIDSDLEVAARALYPSEVPPLPSPVAAAAQSMQTTPTTPATADLSGSTAVLQSPADSVGLDSAGKNDALKPAAAAGRSALAAGNDSAVPSSLPAAAALTAAEANSVADGSGTQAGNAAVAAENEELASVPTATPLPAVAFVPAGGVDSGGILSSPGSKAAAPTSMPGATSASEGAVGPASEGALLASPVTTRSAAAAVAAAGATVDGGGSINESPARMEVDTADGAAAAAAAGSPLGSLAPLDSAAAPFTAVSADAVESSAENPAAGSPEQMTAGSVARKAKAAAATEVAVPAGTAAIATSPAEVSGDVAGGAESGMPLGADGATDAAPNGTSTAPGHVASPAAVGAPDSGTPGKGAAIEGAGAVESVSLSGRKRGRPDATGDDAEEK